MTSRAVVVRPVRSRCWCWCCWAAGRRPADADGGERPCHFSDPQAALARLTGAPLLVVENVGQFGRAAGAADHGVRFQVRGAQGGEVWLTDDGLWLMV